MSRGSRVAVVALVLWSAFVWVTRINNAWTDAGLSAAGKAWSTALAASLLLLAGAAAWVVWATRRSAALSSAQGLVLRVFAGWTVAVWLVRVPQIALADHDVGFKVVHAVLGIVSVALAVVVWRGAGRHTAAEATAGSGDAVSPPVQARR